MAIGGDVAGRLRRAAGWSLVVLAVVLPFEAVPPLAALGPLRLSSVELPLYVTVALWAAAVAAELVAAGRAGARDVCSRWLTPLHLAAAGWAAVTLLAAALAPVNRAQAVKFALRTTGGVTLFVAAADLLRARAVAWRAAGGLIAGAVLASVLMLAESAFPAAAVALRLFHADTFQALGLLRASGPFQYPNIGAMYVEATLALAVTVAAARPAQVRATLTGGLLALVVGLVTTSSRAGLVAAAASLLALALATRDGRITRRWALGTVAALAVVVATTATTGPLAALRLRFWNEPEWYRAEIQPRAGERALPATVGAGQTLAAELVVRNQGAALWPCDGRWPVAVSYHWLDASTGRVAVFEGRRTRLAHDVGPSDALVVRARVRTPYNDGHYLLWWDLVHEQVTWFSQRGAPGLRELVDVRGGDATPAPLFEPAWTARPPGETLPRRALWRAGLAAFREHPLLGVGPDNFRHVYGRTLGLAEADPRLHANSLYFETLADQGLLGLCALAALVAALAWAAKRGAARPLGLAAALGAGAYLLHGTLDYFMEFTPTYAQFWLLAGLLAAQSAPPGDTT